MADEPAGASGVEVVVTGVVGFVVRAGVAIVGEVFNEALALLGGMESGVSLARI